MKNLNYHKARIARGSMSQVANKLGVTPQTIWNRENGKTPVTREAMIALETIPTKTPNTTQGNK